MEDELAGSLRQLKAQGQDDLLRDRFDSVLGLLLDLGSLWSDGGLELVAAGC